ncbi:pitrilysin family protein [Longimicrobium sp.]|uniref:M16 family metallopeptidase n=1 Tax=Longimicrobium sp. TaxID=2029185 RepID=UPI002C80F07B|nr:pitrilysin family protein [Longimicrobium sp.]HSU14392.1 pitrilysin family protein [Longimicrobium sp.]
MSAWSEGGAATGALDRGAVPPRGPLRPYRFPGVHRRRLANGMSLLVAEIRNFPVVTVDMVLDAGGLAEPPELAGIAPITSALLESGAGGMDADAIAERVDGLGLSLDAGVSWDTGQVGFTCLRGRLDAGFELTADLLRRPTFPEREVERVRDERLTTIQQRRGTPSTLVDEAEGRWIFAPGLAFARSLGGLARTVEGLGRDDVVAFHARRYRPSAATLVAAGDASVDEIQALAERWFGDWEGRAEPVPAAEVRPRLDRTTIVVFDRPGSVQSEIRVGHVGIERTAPDYFAVMVLNSILGGTFSSRMNLNLRERLGYTYGASSSFASRRRPGLFSMSTAVQTEVTAHSVSEMLRELRELRESPVTGAELEDARNFLAGVFPIGLQTTDGLAGKLSTIATYGLPDDYYQHYRDGLLSVTAADVQDAAQRRLWPERAAVIIAGDAEKIRGELEALDVGPVEMGSMEELEA